MKNTKKKRPLNLIASDYFNYHGRHLPQQCASDEFYFLPRSEVATEHLNSLDNLTPEKIQDHNRYVLNLLSEISSEEQDNLEEEIDRVLLKQSMKSFIREFNDSKVWRNDPTLYVKIPIFAMDQVLSQRDSTPDQVKTNLFLLFAQIPSFLSLAIKNLHFPSELSLQVILNMTQDAIHFHNIVVCRRRELGENIIYSRELVISKRKGLIRDATYCTHLYSQKKLTTMLTSAGFSAVGFQKDFVSHKKKGDYGCMTNRMIVIADKK